MISNDEIREYIADMQNKIGDYHAIIFSKQRLVDALQELLKYRSIVDLEPSVESDQEYLPSSQRTK